MKLYCIKIYELNRFNISSKTFWTRSKPVADLFMERIMKEPDGILGYACPLDFSKYSTEYFETSDDQLIALLEANAKDQIRIYSNHEGTKSIILVAGQYMDMINGGSILKNIKDTMIGRIHPASVRLAMLLLRYSKNTAFLDYIYRLVKHDFSNIEVDNVEYLLNVKPWLKRYEI